MVSGYSVRIFGEKVKNKMLLLIDMSHQCNFLEGYKRSIKYQIKHYYQRFFYHAMNIRNKNSPPTTKFLFKWSNKNNLTSFFSQVLNATQISVVCCREDPDTTIVTKILYQHNADRSCQCIINCHRQHQPRKLIDSKYSNVAVQIVGCLSHAQRQYYCFAFF